MKHKPHRLLLYILIKVIASLLYPLPLGISRIIGSSLGKLIFLILPKERERTLTHLRIAFGNEKSEKEIKEIARRVFSNLGKNAVEWANYPKLNKRWIESHIAGEGLEHIYHAQKKGKGILILGCHFGNWELLSTYLGYLGIYGTMIIKRIYIEQLNRFFVKMRKNAGNEIIYRGESPKKILRVLKKGGVIAILADQDIDSIEGIFVSFFGKKAYTPVAPVKLAIKTGAALLPMFIIRKGNGFRFVVEKEIDLEITGNKENDILTNTEKWMKVLQEYIRKYPDQWVWMHRRWKTRPIF